MLLSLTTHAGAAHKQALFHNLPPDLQANTGLQENCSQFLLDSVGRGTLNKYKPAWQLFTAWLLKHKITDPFSIDANVLALYITHLILTAQHKHIGSASIQMAIAAIQFFFQFANKPKFEQPFIVRLRQAALRILQPKRSKCEPLSASDLHVLLDKYLTPTCSLVIRMHLTVFLLMFLGLLRFSDVQNIIVHKECMRFVYKNDGTLFGVLIFIPFSKTDQAGEGAWIAVGATNGKFCPAKLLLKLISMGNYCTEPVPGMSSGPLLRAVKLASRPRRFVLEHTSSRLPDLIKPLSASAFRSSLLNLAEPCLAKHFGLHSARSGGASTAAEHGIDSRLVCGLGRWQQGTTFADTYVKMLQGNMFKYFELTQQIWPF